VSDTSLRKRERAAAAGGPEDRARYLKELLRAGTLDPERVALAAYLGDATAASLLGDAAPRPAKAHGEWLLGFERWGKEVVVRAAHALLVESMPLFPPRKDHFPKQRPRTIAAIEAWLAAPSKTTAAAVKAAFTNHSGGAWMFQNAIDAVSRRDAKAAANDLRKTFAKFETPDVRAYLEDVCGVTEVPTKTALRRALCERLIPWALSEVP
jgi:hypothetical protein